MPTVFKKLLIANRGEIAIRIARAATELGIRTVGVYAYHDRFSLHRYKTDESYQLGDQDDPLFAYLNIDAIIELAKKTWVDAIHPGYGFLSENEDFAQACAANGITFIGPEPDVLGVFGDKTKAKEVAKAAGVPIVPGSEGVVATLDQALAAADRIGYPVILKAVSGGGGKGIRLIQTAAKLQEGFERAQGEAHTSFGASELYIEKAVVDPRHIEVQIVGDTYDNRIHLLERDCSIQRRHQKVVEVAPAVGLSEKVRKKLHSYALSIANEVNYSGLGTVEFLVDNKEAIYFLEVNPRIQVEHTVTEMITGIDLVQASILIAAGFRLDDDELEIPLTKTVKSRGVAVQCRITTEDPLADFAPDTGAIIGYRAAAGFGLRLDEGHGTTGGVVTPYYDSLLVKVTAFDKSLPAAASRMARALSEFRIRGVKHNTPLLKNIVRHPKFLNYQVDTNFFSNHPELFEYGQPRDRATKILGYLAEVTVNDPHGVKEKQSAEPVRSADLPATQDGPAPDGSRGLLGKLGPSAFIEWIRKNPRLLLTDTTMRDAHQSLFATRLRSRDIYRAAPYYAAHANSLFSLEVWGGATFDTCMRFLKEDPWHRLREIRRLVPNVLLQMLLRGDNAVGYTSYPEWVVRDFIKETVASGLDLFRVFDCLNQPSKMAVATEQIKKEGALAELCLCYTGNIIDPKRTKYSLEYYIKLAKELESMGADILCIKDMAGLLKPKAAEVLIKALKENIGLPIHLHTHDTSGCGVAMLLRAAEVGCDIVDGAVSSMSGLTSQPSLNAIKASLMETPRDPDIHLATLDDLSRYWETVRTLYEPFDPGIKSNSTDVYVHEIPGGQYSNLFQQARQVGLSANEFFELTERYREVNELLGDIPKVTPSSKVVGDLALLLHKQGLTGPELITSKPQLDYPDSVVSFMRGEMGEPPGGFRQDFRDLVLASCPAAGAEEDSSPDTFDSFASALKKKVSWDPTRADVLSARLYPRVFDDLVQHRSRFGDVSQLDTATFFYGMAENQEVAVDIEPGKTLYILLKGMSEVNAKGRRTVFFKLNGFSREIEVLDESVQSSQVDVPMADLDNPLHVAAPMPGKIIGIKIGVGDKVSEGDALFVTESMKMEYVVTAKASGTIKKIHGEMGTFVEARALLAELS